MEKSPEAFRTISEVADDLEVPQHVLRFWEGKFSQVKPMKRAGGRRYYRPADLELLRGIRHLLYGEGYTIKGVQRILREQGTAYVTEAGRTRALPMVAQDDADEVNSEAPTAATAAADPAPTPGPSPAQSSGPAPQVQEVRSQPAPVVAAPSTPPAPAGMSDADRQALGNVVKELRAVRDLLATVRPV